MLLVKWDKIPDNMKNDEVKHYYDIINKRKGQLLMKRLFDILVSFVMLVIISPIFLVISILIKLDSKGPVFFRQERVTQYGRKFRIFKFRTMVSNAEQLGSQVTVSGDSRVTRIGSKLRNTRIDEIPQLINILIGDMTFVGTRPEVTKYVQEYTDEMRATLLMPAGVTSLASIEFKDENKLLSESEDVDKIYIEKVLPQKMKYNLEYIENFNFAEDIALMLKTVIAVIK